MSAGRHARSAVRPESAIRPAAPARPGRGLVPGGRSPGTSAAVTAT